MLLIFNCFAYLQRRFYLLIWLCALLGGVSACTVGPDYVKPTVTTPTDFKEQTGWKLAEPKDMLPSGQWWTLFNDSDLDALIGQVNISNQNLALAEAQYRQAQALVKQADAAFFPTVSATASAERRRTPPNLNSNNSTNNVSSSNGRISNQFQIGADVSWEPDIWGKVRRTVEASQANAQASFANIEAARLSAQGALAQNYFQLRIIDARKKLLDDTVKVYTQSLQLTQNQYKVGVVARADVLAAEVQLKTAKAQVIDLGVARAQLEHAIAILVGKAPADFSIVPSEQAFTITPPAIPMLIPSALLERRPDIAAAERQMAAANANIGVAKAAYFPSLSLSASAGFQSSLLSKLLTYPARFWAVGPALAETIFDGGLRKAQTAEALAVYDQTVASYKQTILGAFQEVEDNLAALRILEQEAILQDDLVKSSLESVKITTNQYKAGTVSYFDVINAQAIAYNNQVNALNTQNSRLSAAVLLIKAFGGGWDSAELTSP